MCNFGGGAERFRFWSMACLFGTRYPPQTLHSRRAGLEGRLACWGTSCAPYSFIVRLAKLHASTLHLLVQAQEGDDKLGRQLRGADGATLHLVESARAQVDRIQRFQSSASWQKNVAITCACVEGDNAFEMFGSNLTAALSSAPTPPRSCACTQRSKRARQLSWSGGWRTPPAWQVGEFGRRRLQPAVQQGLTAEPSSRFPSCLLPLTSGPADRPTAHCI